MSDTPDLAWFGHVHRGVKDKRRGILDAVKDDFVGEVPNGQTYGTGFGAIKIIGCRDSSKEQHIEKEVECHFDFILVFFKPGCNFGFLFLELQPFQCYISTGIAQIPVHTVDLVSGTHW